MKLKFKKPTGIGIVKIILWAAMIGLFILHIVKRQEWISFIINLLFVFFLHSCGYRQEGNMGRKSGMGNSYDLKNY